MVMGMKAYFFSRFPSFFFEKRENATRVLTKKPIKQRKGILRQLQDL